MEQDVKKVTISKWAKAGVNGESLKMVVIKTPIGKNKKGKVVYSSQTKHERV